MKTISLFTIIAAIFSLAASSLCAQSDTLVIKYKSGASEKIAVTDIKTITFDGVSIVETPRAKSIDAGSAKNYPNPFSYETTIEFFIGKPCDVEIKIYNAAGLLLKTLLCQDCPEGENSLRWDGRDESGEEAPAGAYYYEARLGGEVFFNKMILVK